MTLKQHIRSSIDSIAKMSGVLSRYEKRMCEGLTILTYHRVLPDEIAAEYPLPTIAMPKSAFTEQMAWLAANCQVLPVSDALNVLRQNTERDRPLVSVTFDDGYSDNFEIAAPILEEIDLRVTFFVTVNCIETNELLWPDHAIVKWQAERPTDSLREWLIQLKDASPQNRKAILGDEQPADDKAEPYRMMQIPDIVRLHDAGHEIASHTMTHPILPQLDDLWLRGELNESKRKLEHWLKRKINGIAWPNGDFDGRVERRAFDLGYSYACTTIPGMNSTATDPMRLMRNDMTPSRVTNSDGLHDELSFRAEIALLHEAMR